MRSEKQSMTVFHERSKQSKEKLRKAVPYENFDYATLLGNLQVPKIERLPFGYRTILLMLSNKRKKAQTELGFNLGLNGAGNGT